MMKKMLLLCMALLIMGMTPVGATGTDDKAKPLDTSVGNSLSAQMGTDKALPRVMLLYLNNAKTNYNDEIDAKIMERLLKTAERRWVLTRGDEYKDKLSAMGIQSFTMAERADILAITKNAQADVILLIEIEPFNVRDAVTFFTVCKKVTGSMPIKVIDCNTGLYVYVGKFVEMGQDNAMIGNMGNKSVIMKTVDQMFDKFDLLIPDKIAAIKIKTAN